MFIQSCTLLLPTQPFEVNADHRLIRLPFKPRFYPATHNRRCSLLPCPHLTDLAWSCRSEALERALQTVVSNGLRAGWLDLGHEDSEVMRIIGELPGQPFALRKRDGTEEVDEPLIDLQEVVADEAQSTPVDHATAESLVSGENAVSSRPTPIAPAPRDETEPTPNPA